MTQGGQRDLEVCVCRFLAHWTAFAGHCVFKHHMFFIWQSELVSMATLGGIGPMLTKPRTD